MDVSIFWFRRDLRLADNTALQKALGAGLPVLPVFIFDTNILSELPKDDARVTFIYQTLFAIHKQLRKKGSGLKIYMGDPVIIWEEICAEFMVKKVYANKDYEPYARDRDIKVEALLKEKGGGFQIYKDQVVFEENEILKKDGKPYTVFTPYKNKWLEKFTYESIEAKKNLTGNFYQSNVPFPSLEQVGFETSSINVKPYDLSMLDNYAQTRDYPALDSTSYLSTHLRFGTVSIREIIRQLDGKYYIFLSELIWREFFMQILFHFPKVVSQNFKEKYNGIKWRNNIDDFKRWCNGETGYPLVDAGIRQLNTTGFMHNRVRMVVASFLCKHLLIDWRWGEAYFAKKLLDYELSSNNGNWQWVAGTGCDAAPYFRVFNPTEQLKKFDKDLAYVKKWVPEFNSFSYPQPMVEHQFARKRALKVYKEGIDQLQ